jgi:hypothetical protein
LPSSWTSISIDNCEITLSMGFHWELCCIKILTFASLVSMEANIGYGSLGAENRVERDVP